MLALATLKFAEFPDQISIDYALNKYQTHGLPTMTDTGSSGLVGELTLTEPDVDFEYFSAPHLTAFAFRVKVLPATTVASLWASAKN